MSDNDICGATSPGGHRCARHPHPHDRTHCCGRILANGTREYSCAWVDAPSIGAVVVLPVRRDLTP